jgi:hypothetical protein
MKELRLVRRRIPIGEFGFSVACFGIGIAPSVLGPAKWVHLFAIAILAVIPGFLAGCAVRAAYSLWWFLPILLMGGIVFGALISRDAGWSYVWALMAGGSLGMRMFELPTPEPVDSTSGEQ